ncbi:MAG: chromosome segregation protein SMC [Lachnospiraceae bacterium]|nr:chromosome segregation protein SMC [Lachnospiraceae bacterium]
MYLKSIEILGFKSFAKKIKFEFHDGITAIVGPNGSGKSNVADAVRWVLGEQSAKQLRGTNMQDVIFSGSEARKPQGFAFVEITFDNSDHKLPVSYDEVSVSRRVYRSGESEYMINGMTCRLRDVQELFMDTGIGKEGYSIIGQGQIDRILSTKPEDRRELFDEAAGIVKFKKRKAIAEKNLDEACANLDRIMDIIGEIEKRIGPLEEQSKVAREYLNLKEQLKKLELNHFLCEYDKSDSARQALEEKFNTANDQLNETKAANENAETEYRRLEGIIEDYNKALEDAKNFRQELLIGNEKMEGEIKLFEQQMIAITQNSERINERIAAIYAEIKDKNEELESFGKQKKDSDDHLKELEKAAAEASDKVTAIKNEIAELSSSIESANTGILRLMNEDSGYKSDLQRYNTMLEQVALRRSELAGRMLRNKSELAEAQERTAALEKDYDSISEKVLDEKNRLQKLTEDLRAASDEERRLASLYEGTNEKYIGLRSEFESLKNIAERYEGYGATVRKIMENRADFKGIDGVVADLISVEKKYETAVETALGASISHIVTEDEQTAKNVIEYLKKNKLGRATFLPITSVGRRKQENDPAAMKAKGVISDAAALVGCDDRFRGVINHLLKNFIVVDTIDNALALAKSFDYSLRIVTIEGEQLAPGGSIAGGAYRNSSNLLGRKRELAALEKSVAAALKDLDKVKEQQAALADKKKSIRDGLDETRAKIQELSVGQNSAELNLQKEKQQTEEIRNKGKAWEEETKSLEEKASELNAQIVGNKELLKQNEDAGSEFRNSIEKCNARLVELRFSEGEAVEKVNNIKLEAANVEQAGLYSDENIKRINAEIEKLKAEEEDIKNTGENSRQESEAKAAEIAANREKIEYNTKKIAELEQSIVDIGNKKETVTSEHKSFFDHWAELGKRVTELEKEVMRIQTQKDKLTEQLDYQTNYIWEEYQLTVAGAEQYRDPEFKANTARKDISETKSQIKDLGDVNVNSIEEFKEVSERYTLYSSQRDDLISSKESIRAIIDELDEAMRKQFSEQFALIDKEFNIVFRELFGGGHAKLEMVADEDMLEAGIIIIAQPPGKKLQNMMQLSGGEKALTAISLLFAIQNLKPSPFCLLDEIEAALDDSNVKRFSSYLHKLTKNSQFIVITHRRGTMSAADILYGITMQEKGVSTLVSVNLIEGDLT